MFIGIFDVEGEVHHLLYNLMLIACFVVISKQFKTCLDFFRETKINEEMDKTLKGFDGQQATVWIWMGIKLKKARKLKWARKTVTRSSPVQHKRGLN